MARAAKAKEEKSKKPSSKKTKSILEEEFPLSDVQDLSKTKRTDPNDKKQKAPQPKSVFFVDKIKVEDGNFLTVSYSKIETDGSTSNHPGVSFDNRWMHPDTRQLFLDLRIHFALICEFISVQQLKSIDSYNEKLVDPFTVLSVNIKDGEGVTLTGYKRLKRGAWNFNSLFTRFTDDQENSYRYAEELRDLVEQLQSEVVQYIDGSKVGINPQGTLDLKDPVDQSYVEEGI